jgi:23S rRNA-/tRNA-specific pseudouridylate synthase
MRIDPRGDAAISVVRPLLATSGRAGPVTWVCVRLLTGRRHQARVHLAALGLPVVGDARYGAGHGEGPMLLHAWALDLGIAAAGSGPVLAPVPPTFVRLA